MRRAHGLSLAFAAIAACNAPPDDADAGFDAGPFDGGPAQTDAGPVAIDAGPDAGSLDGGPGGCTTVTAGEVFFAFQEDVRVVYRAPITPEQMDGVVTHLQIRLQDFTMGEGTFDLGSDANREVFFCTHCVQGIELLGGLGGHRVHYHNRSGTMVSRRDAFRRRLDMTITDLVLEEVDGENGPVEGGECLRFDTLELSGVFPPSEWTCAPMAYADGETCHCGCGSSDPDCGPQCELFDPGCDPEDPGFLPVVGCTSEQFCSFGERCLERCDHEAAATCTSGVCAPSQEGDRCHGPDEHDAAAVGEDCTVVNGELGELRRHCAPVDGVSTGHCDDQTNVCRAYCEDDDDCVGDETCGAFENGGTTGQCLPGFPPDG